MTVDTNWDQD